MCEDVFDDAVFQGMVADHRNAPAGIEPAYRRLQTTAQNVEFSIHFDAERLERALGGMAAAPACGSGNSCFDDFDKLVACFDGSALAFAHDEIRDAAGPLLVGIHTNDPSEICCVIGVDDLCCGKGVFARIHPHVKWRLLLEGKAA